MNGTDTYIGQLYATALFELAAQGNMLNPVASDLVSIKEIAISDKDFLELNVSPYFSQEFKSQLLKNLFQDKVASLTLDFLQVVNKHNRMRYINSIADIYEKLLDKHLGRSLVDVTLSKHPEQQEIQNLVDQLSTALNSEVKLNLHVDPSIIGGAIIRHRDTIIDNTIRTQLHEAVKAITTHRTNRERIHEI